LKNNDLKIREELDTVYIDSGGTKHLDYIKALCAEAQIEACRERRQQRRQKIMDIVELIVNILKSENWGVYYKNQPIQPLEMQDGNSLYKVNQVDEEEIGKVITEALAWENSQTNLDQNKNSKTG
jgi:hypothetical protein|tara:strand:+ start:2776 stop:3150 length:375 start_codon:yes stop_codon:yes gene_type:complete